MSAFGFVRLVHVIVMAAWMGSALLAPADVRDSLARGPDAIGPLMLRLRRTARLMNAAAYATVLTGLALVALGRGWATPPRIWVGLGLTLVSIAIGHVLIRPAVGALVAAHGRAEPLGTEEQAQLSRRFAQGVRAEDLTRLGALATMLL